MAINIKITYCGGWGYAGRAKRLQEDLKRDYGDKVDVVLDRTPNISSKFEVFVKDELVHSKIAGDGFVDSDAKFQKIKDAIDKAI